jgi:hypothetical protein
MTIQDTHLQVIPFIMKYQKLKRKDLVKLSNDIEECISLNGVPFDFFY